MADGQSSAITTASYIMVSSVLSQPNTPEGYPDTWGKYTTMDEIAVADYEMDQEMTTVVVEVDLHLYGMKVLLEMFQAVIQFLLVYKCIILHIQQVQDEETV